MDIDEKALSLARDYAEAMNLVPHVQFRLANILDPRGLVDESDPGGLRRGHYDAVDAVGILEYLKAYDWEYGYGRLIQTSRRLAGAITLLRNAYDLVRPGGILVVGNMRDTHPQLGFTLNVIQWPHIQPRSVEEVLDLIDAAGIAGDVEVRCPKDGVYALYTIRKPVA